MFAPKPPMVTVQHAHPSGRHQLQGIHRDDQGRGDGRPPGPGQGLPEGAPLREKAPVKKDQLLFVIDEEPFKVALDMAKAKLDEAEASLKKAEQSKAKEVAAAQLALDQASLVLARLEERRSKALVDRNAGTREALDQSEATRRKAEAQVEPPTRRPWSRSVADYQTNILSAKANVEAAKSDVRNAEINLGYCRITAPSTAGSRAGSSTSATSSATARRRSWPRSYKDDPIYSYVNRRRERPAPVPEDGPRGDAQELREGREDRLDLGLANEEPGSPTRGSSTTPTRRSTPGDRHGHLAGDLPQPRPGDRPRPLRPGPGGPGGEARRPPRARAGAGDRPGRPVPPGRRRQGHRRAAEGPGRSAGGRPPGDRGQPQARRPA